MRARTVDKPVHRTPMILVRSLTGYADGGLALKVWLLEHLYENVTKSTTETLYLYSKPQDSTMYSITNVVVTGEVGNHDCSTSYKINLPNRGDSLLTQQDKHDVGPEVPRLEPRIDGNCGANDIDQGTELEEDGLVFGAG